VLAGEAAVAGHPFDLAGDATGALQDAAMALVEFATSVDGAGGSIGVPRRELGAGPR